MVALCRWLFAVATVLTVAVALPHEGAAAGFKSQDVLAWSETNQSWYFEVSVTMAASIAAQNTKGQSKCVYNWYFQNGKRIATRENAVRDAMARYPDYHPQAVILSLLQKACGSFKYANR